MKFLLIALFLMKSIISFSQEEPSLIFQIDFQDFFNKDIISLSINDKRIVENECITSEPSMGLTKLRIKCNKSNDQVLIQVLGKDYVQHLKLNRKINFKLELNGSKFTYKIDLLKGKYIGFSKRGSNQLYLRHFQQPFMYD